jgi:hypothetical protein
MQQLAGIITENEVMTEESKFSNFVKNIFTSKADKEKAASTAIAAEKAAEAAIRLAKSKEEIEKINSLTNDATFKNLLNDYSSKYYEAYFNLENSAWLNTGDRANVGYWLHELDPLAKPLKDFLKSKGIDPELIIDFSTAMLTNLQSQKQKTNESRMQQLAGMVTENEYQESSKNEAADYNKVDSILKGTYKRPVAEVDPEIKKMANVLDTLVSKPFGYEKLEDILNALGPIEPTTLDKAIDMMKTSVFELNGGDPFYNLIVHSNKYTDEGVALSWEDDHWRAG